MARLTEKRTVYHYDKQGNLVAKEVVEITEEAEDRYDSHSFAKGHTIPNREIW